MDMLDLVTLYFTNIAGVALCLFIVRIFIVILRNHKPKKLISRAKYPTSSIMVVLGSGGHTFEMLRFIEYMNQRYVPRIYVIANTDEMSGKKVKALEAKKPVCNDCKIDSEPPYVIEKIPRSREVNQSWISSFVSSLYAFLVSIPLVFRHMPYAILCNGPGTCIPVCLVAFLLHVSGLTHIKVIYVESICRVQTLSFSGKIMYHLADHFLVQWPQLKEKYPRAKFLRRLI